MNVYKFLKWDGSSWVVVAPNIEKAIEIFKSNGHSEPCEIRKEYSDVLML